MPTQAQAHPRAAKEKLVLTLIWNFLNWVFSPTNTNHLSEIILWLIMNYAMLSCTWKFHGRHKAAGSASFTAELFGRRRRGQSKACCCGWSALSRGGTRQYDAFSFRAKSAPTAVGRVADGKPANSRTHNARLCIHNNWVFLALLKSMNTNEKIFRWTLPCLFFFPSARRW